MESPFGDKDRVNRHYW